MLKGDDAINDLSVFHQSYSGSQFLILSKCKSNSQFLLFCPTWWWKIVLPGKWMWMLYLFLKAGNWYKQTHSCTVNVCRIDWSHINIRIIPGIFHDVFPEKIIPPFLQPRMQLTVITTILCSYLLECYSCDRLWYW